MPEKLGVHADTVNEPANNLLPKAGESLLCLVAFRKLLEIVAVQR